MNLLFTDFAMTPVMLGLLVCLSLLPVFVESGDPGNPLTTHVLDVSKGLPGRNIAVMLYRYRNGVWIRIRGGITDSDGRMGYFLPQARFTPGVLINCTVNPRISLRGLIRKNEFLGGGLIEKGLFQSFLKDRHKNDIIFSMK